MHLTDLRPDRTVDPDGLTAAHTLLRTRIDASSHPADDLAPRRRRGARRLALVGVAAVAAAGVALALPNPTDAPAFAGWTALPAQSSPADLAAAGAQCLELRTAAAPDDPQNLAGAHPVVTDRRGSTTFTVLASEAGLQSCLIGPHVSSSTVVTGQGGSSLQSSSDDETGSNVHIGTVREDVPPAADGATFVGGETQGFGSDEPWGSAVGRVGALVTSVEVGLSDGTTLTASVHDGVWAGWWPGESHVASVTPTLADGSTGTSPEIERYDLAVVEGSQSGGSAEGTEVVEDD